MTEKITKYALSALMGISVVILIAFFAVGFDTPYEENPKFNEPVLIDLLLVWMSVLTVGTIVVTLWGLFNSLTTKGTGTMKETGLIANTNSIAWGACAASIVIGLVIGFMNKGEQIMINGEVFSDKKASISVAGDIIMTDTIMVSIGILFLATIIATIASVLPAKK